MRKKIILFVAILLCMLLMIIICFFVNKKIKLWAVAEEKREMYKQIVQEIGISIPYYSKIEYRKNYPGFNGDGTTYCKIFFTEEQADVFLDVVKYKKYWEKLPMPEKLQQKVSMDNCNYIECMEIVQNGYWYFWDRHSEATDRHNENDIYDRCSYNYTVSVYDVDNKVLHYYTLDT